MLQISTGKFFEKSAQSKHVGKFVFFSNVCFWDKIKIRNPKISLETIEYGDISCVYVEYILITEKPEKIEAGVVNRAGDGDFIEQFLFLWEFYFGCIARVDKELVRKICLKKRVSNNTPPVVSDISPNLVELGRRLKPDEIEGFLKFIDSLMKVKRELYRSLISSFRIIYDVKETVNTNFDLAYSMLVYSLESLSQKHDGYTPQWSDYHDDVRNKLDPILNDMDSKVALQIKDILIGGKQFKLRKRFESFILDNIEDEFYFSQQKNNIQVLRKSLLPRCLYNLYQLRSSFVHELKSLDVMISKPHNKSNDYLVRFEEPYLTFTGLMRLIREVIINFIVKNRCKLKEEVYWLGEVKGIFTAELSSEYWINKAENFTQQHANHWFSHFIEMINKNKVYTQDNIMKKIEMIFDSSDKKYKSDMFMYYWLYHGVFHNDNESWQQFLEKRDKFFIRKINYYVLCIYLYNSLSYYDGAELKPLDIEEFSICYSEYEKKRFHKGSLKLPTFTEVMLMCIVANRYLIEENIQQYESHIKKSLCEIGSNKNVFDYIFCQYEKRELIDINNLISNYRENV